MKNGMGRRLHARLIRIPLAVVMLLGAALFGLTGAHAAPPGSGAGAGPAALPPATSGFGPIRTLDGTLCVQPLANSESGLVLKPCNGSSAQKWFFDPKENGNHIINQLAGLCVYMNGPVAGGSPNIQTGCTTVTNEDWAVSDTFANTTIVSRASHRDTNLCLTPQLSVAGAPLLILTCNGSFNQLWAVGP
jgi:hypothetical protein